ncbi:MFS transporter [Acidaminobacter sp. JC074]|uniref:MFS transporter n=1 Tax=Acidaminobacter sp. JC074 TaxID=2530199 RepID=UPI001F0CE2B7|nr:MFS transporter [Acidaminobacter sp. JC074]
MDKQLQLEIKKDRQIWKFCAYGFLKNLQFFEPYLFIYLLGKGMNLFDIGILFGISQLITYIFEIPSGIIADLIGKKKELSMCFVFYIISFILFFFVKDFKLAVLAMVFFGLGEAFRSGTHKAMIYKYLELKGWEKHKVYVYGRTRSYSLKGSAISSILAIILILNIPSSNYIFLITVIPYILDLLLILSYPSELDRPDSKKTGSVYRMIKDHLLGIFKKPELRRILLNSASFDGFISICKDYIQPILEAIILASGLVVISSMSADDNLKIILGLVYFVINILGSAGSKRIYKASKYLSSDKLMNLFYLALIICFFIMAISIKFQWTLLIILAFIILRLSRDMRKPIFVDHCDHFMDKSERATVLSIDSQLKAFIIIILSPALGFIAENYGMDNAMFIIGIILSVLYAFVRINHKKAQM